MTLGRLEEAERAYRDAGTDLPTARRFARMA